MKIIFSIIVPVYNMEKYLDRCMHSILNQACNNYEIILIDDGSFDKSSAMCDYYAYQYECIKVIHQKNKGLAASRNRGIQEAKGKYIVFVDSDDTIDRMLLTKAYTQMEENSYDLCSFAVRRVDEKDKILYEMYFTEMVKSIDFDKEDISSFLYTKFLQYKTGWEVCFHVFRTEMIREHHILFKETLNYAEDLPFTFEYLLYTKSWIKIPDVLYNYRVRDTSISVSSTEEKILYHIFADIYACTEDAIKRVGAPHKGVDGSMCFAALLNYFVLREEVRIPEQDKLKIIKSIQRCKLPLQDLCRKKEKVYRTFGESEGEKIYTLVKKLI